MSTTQTAPAIGIIMVHGYCGSPADLAPLASALCSDYGAAAINCLCLPGHAGAGEMGAAPIFDTAAFIAEISTAIDDQLAAGRQIILLGHSIGGSLLLAAIAERQKNKPNDLQALRLLILCATPPRIDLSYAQRWEQQAGERASRIDDICALVSLVNRPLRQAPLTLPAPVLIIHGSADELVPIADTELWRNGHLRTTQRQLSIADAGHHLFKDAGAAIAIASIRLAIADACQRQQPALPTWSEQIPDLHAFCQTWPDSTLHLQQSPAGQRFQRKEFVATPLARYQPTVANIEITTRCNLGCIACARTQNKRHSKHMSREHFRQTLEHLPHAWRIVLVGLGEPLLHPEVIELIKIAVTAGRHISLVTNAMMLDQTMAEALCASGLAGITFSLDAMEQSTAECVRPGSDMTTITNNIRGLLEVRRRHGAKLATSIFTALSKETITEFEHIVDFAADHKIDALMVSDLNFASNQERSVNHHLAPEQAQKLRHALRKAASLRLPVLSVRGLEEFALETRYLDYLVLRGEHLAQRSPRHNHCLSPWQSIPVSVDGNLTLCDCQPEAIIGNIHRQPINQWWNGSTMINHRQRMLGDNPPEACLVCPRF